MFGDVYGCWFWFRGGLDGYVRSPLYVGLGWGWISYILCVRDFIGELQDSHMDKFLDDGGCIRGSNQLCTFFGNGLDAGQDTGVPLLTVELGELLPMSNLSTKVDLLLCVGDLGRRGGENRDGEGGVQ